MLSFVVLDENGPVSDWPLRQAHLIGADGVVLPGEIHWKDGLICCEPRGRTSTAVALQWHAGDPGILTLRTCLLPESERPYLLSLELARRSLMLFLVKLEQWQLFDLPDDTKPMALFEDAHASFMNALAHGSPIGGYTVEQDRLARHALSKAIEASEELVAAGVSRHELGAESGEPDDQQPQPLALGCVVPTKRFSPQLQEVVSRNFDFITASMRWVELEPEEGRYQFAAFDRWIEWAVRKARVPVTAGPVIDFRPHCIPDWLYIWENDYETLRQLVYEHVKRVVTRYRRAVSRWTIASGLHVNSNFTLSLEQIVDLTRLCVLMVRKLKPTARLQLEIAQPFGEYCAKQENGIPPLLYTELLFQAGISIDSIGLRLEMGDPSPGCSSRDLIQLADLLDHYSEFEKPMTISALAAPSAPPSAETVGDNGQFDPGYWNAPWSPTTQADWMTRIVQLARRSQHITSVCFGQLCDGLGPPEVHQGGLVTADGQPKESLARVEMIHKRLQARERLSDLVGGGVVSGAGE